MPLTDEQVHEMAAAAGITMTRGGEEVPPTETPVETIPEPILAPIEEGSAPPPPPVNTTQEVNILAKLNEQLGTNFTDLSEVSNLMAENSRLSQAEQDVIIERNQYQSPFANDKVLQYNEFVKKTGIEDFNVFAKVSGSDVATMSDQEALALAMVIKKPKLSAQWDLVKEMATKNYAIEVLEEGEYESKDSQFARLQMEADADEARKEISATKAKLTAEPFKIDSEAETRRMESLTPVAKQLVEKLSKREYPLGIGDERFVFTVPTEAMPEYIGAALEYAKRNGLKDDPSGRKQIAAFIDYNIKASYQDEIIKSYGETLRSEAYREKVKQFNNPTPANPEQPIAESVGDPFRELAKQMFPKGNF